MECSIAHPSVLYLLGDGEIRYPFPPYTASHNHSSAFPTRHYEKNSTALASQEKSPRESFLKHPATMIGSFASLALASGIVSLFFLNDNNASTQTSSTADTTESPSGSRSPTFAPADKEEPPVDKDYDQVPPIDAIRDSPPSIADTGEQGTGIGSFGGESPALGLHALHSSRMSGSEVGSESDTEPLFPPTALDELYDERSASPVVSSHYKSTSWLADKHLVALEARAERVADIERIREELQGFLEEAGKEAQYSSFFIIRWHGEARKRIILSGTLEEAQEGYLLSKCLVEWFNDDQRLPWDLLQEVKSFENEERIKAETPAIIEFHLRSRYLRILPFPDEEHKETIPLSSSDDEEDCAEKTLRIAKAHLLESLPT